MPFFSSNFGAAGGLAALAMGRTTGSIPDAMPISASIAPLPSTLFGFMSPAGSCSRLNAVSASTFAAPSTDDASRRKYRPVE